MKFESLPDNTAIGLDPIGTWPAASHRFTVKQVAAVVAAWHAGRPLLVRGEAGIGKSQLARAVAQHLNWAFIPVVIQPRMDYHDMMWRLDGVARLGRAQLMAAVGLSSLESESAQQSSDNNKGTNANDLVKEALAEEQFIQPGPLWWAYRPKSAKWLSNKNRFASPVLNNDKESAECVLLIDEIDKADADLPNSLLELFGNGDLNIPFGQDKDEEYIRKPLVIITSNDEREMPQAFLRRCLVLDLALPKDACELKRDLLRIADANKRLGSKMQESEIANVNDALLKKVIELVIERRCKPEYALKPPGVAEFLDLLRILGSLGGSYDEQYEAFCRVSDLVLNKASSAQN